MGSTAQVTIDSSQFPQAVRAALLESLRTRRVNHKFHYDSYKQTQKWLRVHECHSPFGREQAGLSVYQNCFAEFASLADPGPYRLIGLGCGSGKKDAQLLGQLQPTARVTSYVPCDVSVAMVLIASQAVHEIRPSLPCSPTVFDLATVQDAAALLDVDAPKDPSIARIFTFFGMLPNFEPGDVLSKLAAVMRPDDYLLASANLAPGSDYDAGVQQILPQYDNALTRDWLMTFLTDLGVQSSDGSMEFLVEQQPTAPRLKRVAAYFRFARPRSVTLETDRFDFNPGNSIRLLFSYRHTLEVAGSLLGPHGLSVVRHWIDLSGEEGIFLVKKSG